MVEISESLEHLKARGGVATHMGLVDAILVDMVCEFASNHRFLFRNDPQTPYRPELNCKILPQKIKLASAVAVGRVRQRWLEEGFGRGG